MTIFIVIYEAFGVSRCIFFLSPYRMCLCRGVRSLGFSLACVCSLNNKYHKYTEPRKTATKPDFI